MENTLIWKSVQWWCKECGKHLTDCKCRLRDMETPTALGYELDRNTLTPIRRPIDLTDTKDYGADPIGDGMFRMVPSGDIVDLTERNRRLSR